MSVVSPELLRFVAEARTSRSIPSHQRTAISASAFPKLLTQGELWFLDVVRRLSVLSDRQHSRLADIALKVERGRR